MIDSKRDVYQDVLVIKLISTAKNWREFFWKVTFENLNTEKISERSFAKLRRLRLSSDFPGINDRKGFLIAFSVEFELSFLMVLKACDKKTKELLEAVLAPYVLLACKMIKDCGNELETSNKCPKWRRKNISRYTFLEKELKYSKTEYSNEKIRRRLADKMLAEWEQK